jgi:uncharacterized protein (TIGR02996 family)
MSVHLSNERGVSLRIRMSTSTVTALEAHLRKNPDDWSSWLVFGDHLTEQGDVRGELIRLEHQHATARLSPADRDALAKTIQALIAQHQSSWKQTVPSDAAPEGEAHGPLVRLDWRHGFVVGLELGWVEYTGAALQQFLSSPDARLLSTLAVTRVGLANEEYFEDEEDFDEETGLPKSRVDPESIAGALEGVLSQDLSRLVTLSFAYLGMGAAGAKRLAKATVPPQLEQLDLRYNFIQDAGLKALCTSSVFSNLSALHLQANRLGPAGVKALAALELPRLKVLDLRRNELKSTGAKTLAASRLLSALTHLGLQRDDIGGLGVKALAQSTQLPAPLRTLWKGLFASKPTPPREDE